MATILTYALQSIGKDRCHRPKGNRCHRQRPSRNGRRSTPENRQARRSESLLGIRFGSSQENLRIEAHFVIGIDVLEQNLTLLTDNKDGRHRQDMVLGSRMLLQINLVLILIGVEDLITYTKGDAEFLNPGCFAVGYYCVCETLFFNGG